MSQPTLLAKPLVSERGGKPRQENPETPVGNFLTKKLSAVSNQLSAVSFSSKFFLPAFLADC
jgi:hypothetical protein